MTRAEMAEVAVTSAVTAAIVFAAFVALRLAFPDAPLEGSACPASMGEPAYGNCIRSWHTSNAARETHRVATGLGVVFLATLAGLVVERRHLIPWYRLSLALAMGAGFAAPVALVIPDFGPQDAVYLGASALFALASVLPSERAGWGQMLAATTIGVLASAAVFLTFFVFFYRAY